MQTELTTWAGGTCSITISHTSRYKQSTSHPANATDANITTYPKTYSAKTNNNNVPETSQDSTK